MQQQQQQQQQQQPNLPHSGILLDVVVGLCDVLGQVKDGCLEAVRLRQVACYTSAKADKLTSPTK
jgi:hypothetical protein